MEDDTSSTSVKPRKRLLGIQKIKAIESSIANSLEKAKSSDNVHKILVEAVKVRKLITEAYSVMDNELTDVQSQFKLIKERQQKFRALVIENITKEEEPNNKSKDVKLTLSKKSLKKGVPSKNCTSVIHNEVPKAKEAKEAAKRERLEAIERKNILEELKVREQFVRDCMKREEEEARQAKMRVDEIKKSEDDDKMEHKRAEDALSDSSLEYYFSDRETGPYGVSAVIIKPISDVPTESNKAATKFVTKSKEQLKSETATNEKSVSKVSSTKKRNVSEIKAKSPAFVRRNKSNKSMSVFNHFKVTIKAGEFEHVPTFVRGRESFVELKNFLQNIIIPCFVEKYELLKRERTKVNDRMELVRWKLFNKQEEYVPGREFITKNDIMRKTGKVMDKKIKNHLMLLMYLGILQDLRYRQNICYIWTVIN